MLKLIIIFLPLIFMMSCADDDHQSSRDRVNAQNNATAEAKKQELLQAEGTYSGKLHMEKLNQDVDVIFNLKRFTENIRTPQADQPNETVQISKLAGTISFPILDHSDGKDIDMLSDSNFTVLLNAMGRYRRVMIDYGDFNTKTLELNLPYQVPGYSQGNFGEFTGELSGDAYAGNWYAKPYGTVGNFVVIRQNTSSAGAQP
ncbi:MAG: hypothetical protein JWQ35_2666 [Bacteriovoracaceae bacterium]|nr:hypothetical protein [Bacteriovoracaceae bacterium]